MKEITTKNNKETFDLGQKLASVLFSGAVVGLVGDLGGGKTTFTKGIAKGLGITENIASPTFVLMKEYQILIKKNLFLCHFDLYRLSNDAEIEAIGFYDYIGNQSKISIIEWADRAKHILGDEKLIIEFDFIDSNTRKVIFKPFGNKYGKLVNKLF